MNFQNIDYYKMQLSNNEIQFMGQKGIVIDLLIQIQSLELQPISAKVIASSLNKVLNSNTIEELMMPFTEEETYKDNNILLNLLTINSGHQKASPELIRERNQVLFALLEIPGVENYLDYRDPRIGNTALTFAIKVGAFDFATKLLDKGANPNKECQGPACDNFTPAQLVSIHPFNEDGVFKKELIKKLYKSGADFEATNNFGYSALKYLEARFKCQEIDYFRNSNDEEYRKNFTRLKIDSQNAQHNKAVMNNLWYHRENYYLHEINLRNILSSKIRSIGENIKQKIQERKTGPLFARPFFTSAIKQACKKGVLARKAMEKNVRKVAYKMRMDNPAMWGEWIKQQQQQTQINNTLNSPQ